ISVQPIQTTQFSGNPQWKRRQGTFDDVAGLHALPAEDSMPILHAGSMLNTLRMPNEKALRKGSSTPPSSLSPFSGVRLVLGGTGASGGCRTLVNGVKTIHTIIATM